MNPVTAPNQSYTRVSEIPSWLAKLSAQDLSELIEKRLLGFPAGLPLPSRDEEPKDILEYAFRKADDNLIGKLRQALRGVVDRLAAAVLSRGAAVLEDRYDFLEGVCSLVAYTSSGGTWDSLSLLYNRLGNDNAKAVRTVILRCLAGLVRPADPQALDVFGPMVEKFESLLTDFDLCGLAFQALFRYDTRRAARAVPRLAATLLSQSAKDAPHSLARVLSPMVALLPETEQGGFIANAWDAAWKVGVKGSTELVDCVLQGLHEMWGIAPGVRHNIGLLWQLDLFTEPLIKVSRHCKFIDETAGKKPTNLGSYMIADDLTYVVGPECATKLNRTGDLVEKYGSPGLEIDDDWVAVVPDTSARYKDNLDQILKSEVHVHVAQAPKSSTSYVGGSYRRWKTGESSTFIRIGPEQEQYLNIPSSKASGRHVALRKVE